MDRTPDSSSHDVLSAAAKTRRVVCRLHPLSVAPREPTMRAVCFLVMHDFRRRWSSWTIVLVVLAVSAGVVFTAFAGARRTDSAFPHLLQWSRPADMLVAPEGSGLGSYDTAVGHLPVVEEAGPVVGIQALPICPAEGSTPMPRSSPPRSQSPPNVRPPQDSRWQAPWMRQPNEVAIDVTAANHLHLGVGSVLRLGAVGGATVPNISAGSLNGSSAWLSHEKMSYQLRILTSSERSTRRLPFFTGWVLIGASIKLSTVPT